MGHMVGLLSSPYERWTDAYETIDFEWQMLLAWLASTWRSFESHSCLPYFTDILVSNAIYAQNISVFQSLSSPNFHQPKLMCNRLKCGCNGWSRWKQQISVEWLPKKKKKSARSLSSIRVTSLSINRKINKNACSVRQSIIGIGRNTLAHGDSHSRWQITMASRKYTWKVAYFARVCSCCELTPQ